MKDQFPCVVCGKPLNETGGAVLLCSYCGESEKSDLTCNEGHYVCETCRTCSPIEIIKRTCMATSSTDALFLANLLMHHPAIPISGPEHHYLVPAVLLAVAHNTGFIIALEHRLGKALKYATKFGLGSCANMGACGAAMGVPVAVSLLIDANYTKPKERKSVLVASAASLNAISLLPGPRCCIASVYSSLCVGTAYLHQKLGLKIDEITSPTCQFQEYNPECLGEECPYFKHTLIDGDAN